ncbi:MAG: response regulator transcription factor [Bacteroidetes bacterium]|nr:response regulator transcription factor [Bacteroidota bacterium]
MNERILIVEDEPSIAIRLEDDLTLEGYAVVVVDDGVVAVKRALEDDFDLMILDVMLPGKSGYDVCREVRKVKPQLPILMLTAKSHEAEKVLGLEMGADDYVTKPFSPLELRARIRALLRRSSASEQTIFSFGPFTMDVERMEVRSGDDRLDFTLLEFKLLAALVQNKGHVVARNRLLDLVWGADVVVTDRAIDTHVTNIRKKLGPKGSDFIASVRGMGYRFEG